LRARDAVGADADHTAAVKYWEALNAMLVSHSGMNRVKE
jgi:hypothetical protein